MRGERLVQGPGDQRPVALRVQSLRMLDKTSHVMR